MKINKRFLLTAIFCLFCISQDSLLLSATNNVPFGLYLKRHFPKHITDIPLTQACIIKNTSIPNNSGWITSSDFTKKDKSFIFLLEMGASNVPQGPWDDDVGGAVQIAIKLDTIEKNQKIVLDKINGKNFNLINNFARYEDKTLLSGEVIINESGESALTLTGKIILKSRNPATYQEINFRNSKVRIIDLQQLHNEEVQEDKKSEEKERLEDELNNKILTKTKKFNTHIFSPDKFPNKLIGRWEGVYNNKRFKFKTDFGYLAKQGRISKKPTNNLLNMTCGDIFSIQEGKKYILYMHFFDEADPNIIDDEINYCILIDLGKNISDKNIDLSNHNARFATYGWGMMGNYTTTKVKGAIKINSVVHSKIVGKMKLAFKGKNFKQFILEGDFQLPLIDSKTIVDFNNRITAFRTTEESKILKNE